eukprot:7438511-Alexandrium_andersonii.AAC.1
MSAIRVCDPVRSGSRDSACGARCDPGPRDAIRNWEPAFSLLNHGFAIRARSVRNSRTMSAIR